MDNPYKVGDDVMASRAGDGENHEAGSVIDAHVLIIGEEERPMIRVLFADGTHAYLSALSADVMPAEAPETGEGADGG